MPLGSYRDLLSSVDNSADMAHPKILAWHPVCGERAPVPHGVGTADRKGSG